MFGGLSLGELRPRFHYDDQWSGLITVFVVRVSYFCRPNLVLFEFFKCFNLPPHAGLYQVLSGENWNEIMWTGFREKGATAVLFYCTLYLAGNFILLNM